MAQCLLVKGRHSCFKAICVLLCTWYVSESSPSKIYWLAVKTVPSHCVRKWRVSQILSYVMFFKLMNVAREWCFTCSQLLSYLALIYIPLTVCIWVMGFQGQQSCIDGLQLHGYKPHYQPDWCSHMKPTHQTYYV